MLNSCTAVSNKINMLDSFEKDDGCIKVLVATFGMGVDCKNVYRTIHFGPAKNI
jgi:superfamily II DNA helicase RecQ